MLGGKDRAKKGKVIKVMPRDNFVVVEGINIRKRHERSRRAGQKGQTVDVTMPVHVSTVALVDGESGKQTRVRFKEVGGKKVRVSAKSGKEI